MEPRLRAALARAEELARAMADPAVARDPAQLKALGREHVHLEPVVRLHERLERLREELRQAREMLDEPDPELAALARADATRLSAEVEQGDAALHDLLMPRD
ncbi:MAG: PCRF domain-containing protein, partial [Gemmatimonadales bacterium]|nr:PCRF domain-containing protein [Gemmatimonadales bacterium]